MPQQLSHLAMPTTSAPPIATAALSPSLHLLRRPPPPPPPSLSPLRAAHPSPRASRCVSCQVALTAEVPSSSASDEAAAAVAKVGARVRVTAPLKVYHVTKAPDLDLCGLEGTVKQYVGLWKGKTISANLPFKIEFLLPADGGAKPVKFFAHLKEDEFELLPTQSD